MATVADKQYICENVEREGEAWRLRSAHPAGHPHVPSQQTTMLCHFWGAIPALSAIRLATMSYACRGAAVDVPNTNAGDVSAVIV